MGPPPAPVSIPNKAVQNDASPSSIIVAALIPGTLRKLKSIGFLFNAARRTSGKTTGPEKQPGRPLDRPGRITYVGPLFGGNLTGLHARPGDGFPAPMIADELRRQADSFIELTDIQGKIQRAGAPRKPSREDEFPDDDFMDDGIDYEDEPHLA